MQKDLLMFRRFYARALAVSRYQYGSVGYLIAIYNQLWPYDDARIAGYLQCTVQRLPDLYAAKLPLALARAGDSLMIPLDVLPALLRECRELGRAAGCNGDKLALLLHRAHLLNRGKRPTGAPQRPSRRRPASSAGNSSRQEWASIGRSTLSGRPRRTSNGRTRRVCIGPRSRRGVRVCRWPSCLTTSLRRQPHP